MDNNINSEIFPSLPSVTQAMDSAAGQPSEESPWARLPETERSYGTASFPLHFFTDRGQQISDGRLDWHWHRELEFLKITAGAVTCHAGPDPIMLRQGDLLFLNSNAVHRYDYSWDSVMEIAAFAPEFIAPGSSRIYSQAVLPFTRSDLRYIHISTGSASSAGLSHDFDQLLKSRSCTEYTELELHIRLCALWKRFLESYADQFQLSSSSSDTYAWDRLQNMITHIHRHYSENLRLSDIAASAGISKSEALLLTSQQIRACHRLKTSTDTITAIAMETGFSDAGYFCKVFRKYTGMSPKEYRKQPRDDAPD